MSTQNITSDQHPLEGEHRSSGIIYVSGGPSGITRNGYQRYNSFRSQTKEDFMDEDSVVMSESNVQYTRDSANTSSSVREIMSEMNPSAIMTDNRSNRSLPTSNELRQRIGVNNNNNNMENRARYTNIHHGLHHSNRVRSFTSPDTRSPQRYNNGANNTIQSLNSLKYL
jgi:hypothetical protein